MAPAAEGDGGGVAVEVAVFAPVAGLFSYRWPSALGKPVPGLRVSVPFGSSARTGVVMQPVPDDGGEELREVHDRLDIEPLYDEVRRRWLERVRRYYCVSHGEAWTTALAWAAHDEMRRFSCPDIAALEHARPVLAGIFKSRAALSLKTICNRGKRPGMRHAVLSALRDGLLSEAVREEEPQQPLEAGPQPTDDQAGAIDAIHAAGRRFRPFLLFGRTGSGKTEVYIRVARHVIEKGGQVLVLVPEIGLTPMWLARLKRRFRHIGLWHSAMTPRERLSCSAGLARMEVLIGTRSALFLPLPRLAMIIVDEEHDGSFKQQEGMAYSARDMAVLLAQEMDIPVVLGSATPSLESWRHARDGHYRRLDLPRRIGTAPPTPTPEIIDMRGVNEPLSGRLEEALRETVARGEQAMLYLNRRGYAPALQCTACGDVPECPDCSMRLTLHRGAGQLRCHSCGHVRSTPRHCGQCGEAAYMPLGEGTEKLEEWLASRMPALRFARFDRDVMTSQKRLIDTLADFAQGRLDCLIGTQMLIKGHDFHAVTLVGVVNADLGISMPDFRAGERWWQQMTQVFGRAGRGDRPGRVIIQTRMPDAAWLARVSKVEAGHVLDEELSLREQLAYPPFARWVRVVFSAVRAERAMQAAELFAKLCRDARAGLEQVQVSGPMPCPIERVARRFRFEVLLRDPERRQLPWRLATVLAAQKLPSGVRRRVDVDPMDMM